MTTDDATPAAPVQRLVGRIPGGGIRLTFPAPPGAFLDGITVTFECKDAVEEIAFTDESGRLVALFKINPPNVQITGPKEANHDDR